MTTHNITDVIQLLQDPAKLDQIASMLAEQMPPPDDAGNVQGAAPQADVLGGSILPTGPAVPTLANAPPPPQILGEGAARAGGDTVRLRQEYQRYAIETQINGGVPLPWEAWLQSKGVSAPNTGGG